MQRQLARNLQIGRMRGGILLLELSFVLTWPYFWEITVYPGKSGGINMHSSCDYRCILKRVQNYTNIAFPDKKQPYPLHHEQHRRKGQVHLQPQQRHQDHGTKSCLTCSILLKSQRGGKISNNCQLFILFLWIQQQSYKHLQNSPSVKGPSPRKGAMWDGAARWAEHPGWQKNNHVFLHPTVHPLWQRLHEQQQHQRGIPDLKLQWLHQVPQGGEPGVRRKQQWRRPGQEIRAVATLFATFKIRCLFC